MPQPTLQDVHVNRPLTNISVAYLQEAAGVEFVADKAFPAVPVENKSDLYYTYARADFNRDEMQKRALATESAGTGYNLNSTGTYNCDVWSLHKDVDDQIRSNSDSPLAPDRDATIFLTQKALIRRENQWVSKFFGTGIWTNQVSGQATADSTHVVYWDSGNYPNGNPITDIRHAKTQMRLSSGGFAPNIFVVSRPVFDKLVDHPDFIDRTKYGQTAPNPAVATRQIMAEILELEEVLVIDAVYNTAAEGAAESNAFIGGLSAALFYRPKNAGLMTPSAGYVFNWTGLIGTHRRRRRPHQDVPHGAPGFGSRGDRLGVRYAPGLAGLRLLLQQRDLGGVAMMLRRESWARLTRGLVPPLYVLRPLQGFTPSDIGDEYPAPDATNKVQLTRARQLYEQRRIGTQAEAERALSKLPKQEPAKPGKEKRHGNQSGKNAR